jgi:hypothetical protein
MRNPFICPMALGVGFVYLVLGDRVTSVLGTPREPEPAAWVLGLVLLGIGIALYFWLRSSLEASGYQFNGI